MDSWLDFQFWIRLRRDAELGVFVLDMLHSILFPICLLLERAIFICQQIWQAIFSSRNHSWTHLTILEAFCRLFVCINCGADSNANYSGSVFCHRSWKGFSWLGRDFTNVTYTLRDTLFIYMCYSLWKDLLILILIRLQKMLRKGFEGLLTANLFSLQGKLGHVKVFIKVANLVNVLLLHFASRVAEAA
jgi:hypothetical protein